jgi:hypothetical protein
MDIMKVEILEDGVVSVTTTDFKDSNHMSADQLLDEVHELLGGDRKIEANEQPKKKSRLHVHKHVKAGR